MKILHTLLTSLAIAPLSVAVAQTTADSAPGLLGQRYMEAHAGGVASERASGLGFDTGARYSTPIFRQTDVAISYDYRHTRPERIGAFSQTENSRQLNADVTEYVQTGAIKPFATAGLGYRWEARQFNFGRPWSDTHDNGGTWRVGVGAEVPVSSITVTPSMHYYDGINNHQRGFTYAVQAHTWLTHAFGVFANVAYDDPRNRITISEPLMIAAVSPDGLPTSYIPISPVPPTSETLVVVPLGASNRAWEYNVGATYRF